MAIYLSPDENEKVHQNTNYSLNRKFHAARRIRPCMYQRAASLVVEGLYGYIAYFICFPCMLSCGIALTLLYVVSLIVVNSSSFLSEIVGKNVC